MERDLERERNRSLVLERNLETARADAAEAQSKLQSVLLDPDRNWTRKVSKEERKAKREQTMAELTAWAAEKIAERNAKNCWSAIE